VALGPSGGGDPPRRSLARLLGQLQTFGVVLPQVRPVLQVLVGQHGSFAAPQHAPLVHVPPVEHLAVGKMHWSLPGSQQSRPKQVLPAQQYSFCFPQAPHAPCSQTVPGSPVQVLPCWTQLETAATATQQFPFVQVLEAQQSCVAPPQSVHAPPVQTLACPPAVVVQSVLLPTQAWSSGSQQEPAPVQAVPVRQHAAPFAPHVEHAPLKQTLFAPPHATSGPTHVLFVGSQHAPAAEHSVLLPRQHASPVAPHGLHVPAEQRMFVPWQY
jgi:hypothetical protein